MRKFWKITIGGIQHKIFNIFLLGLILVMGAFMGVIAFQTRHLSTIVAETNDQQKQSINTISEQTMDYVVDDSLTTSTALEAFIADNLFSGVGNNMNILARAVADVYENPGQYNPRQVLPPDAANDGTVAVQLVRKGDEKQIGLLGNLGELMKTIFSEGALNSVFIGTADGAFIIADSRSAEKFDSSGSLKFFDTLNRPWYKAAAETGNMYFSDIEKDSFSDNIGIVCSVPVYAGGKLVAVVGADLFVNNIADAIEASFTEGRFTVIINDKAQVIFAPSGQDVFHMEEPVKGDGLYLYVYNAIRGDSAVREVNVDGTEYFMSAAPIPTMGWSIVSVVDKARTQAPAVAMTESFDRITDNATQEFEKGLNNSRNTMIILLIAVFIIGSAVAIFSASRIVRPLTEMTKRIRDISGSDLSFEMSDTYRTKDEIEILATSFADLSFRTQKYIEEITRITTEKERIGAELNVATQIQSDMLPRIFPAYPDRLEFDIYASMRPAKEVGGDFYDFFLTDPCHIALVIADVSGKGVPAALFMVIAKTLLKNRAQQGGHPSEILADVNQQLCEGNESELFVTVWLAIIDLRTGKGWSCNAGHEHPAIRHKGGQFELVEYPHSPAVAMMEGMTFREREFKLDPGDDLFVYTDGIPEATNHSNEMFGTDRMLQALNHEGSSSPEQIIKSVGMEIHAFIDGNKQFDDLTMLCFHYFGPKDGWFVREFDASTSKLDEVLAFLDGGLEEHDCPMKEQTTLDIAVEEIFVNIANYAYEDGKGKAYVGIRFLEDPRTVEILFRDEGKPFDPLKKEDPDITKPAEEREIGGLGIYMVKKSMDSVTYSRRDNMNELILTKKF